MEIDLEERKESSVVMRRDKGSRVEDSADASYLKSTV